MLTEITSEICPMESVVEPNKNKELLEAVLKNQSQINLRQGLFTIPVKLVADMMQPKLTRFNIKSITFGGNGAVVTVTIPVPLFGDKDINVELKNIIIERKNKVATATFEVAGAAAMVRLAVPLFKRLLASFGINLSVSGSIWTLDVSDKMNTALAKIKADHPEFATIAEQIILDTALRIDVANDQIRIKPQITVSEEHKTTARQLLEAVLV